LIFSFFYKPMTQELELNIDYDALNADIAKEKERMELS
jgi:hypothetical protein